MVENFKSSIVSSTNVYQWIGELVNEQPSKMVVLFFCILIEETVNLHNKSMSRVYVLLCQDIHGMIIGPYKVSPSYLQLFMKH